MSERFDVPGRIHPRYSLLGRMLRARIPDRSRAEAMYYVAAVGLLTVYACLLFASWAWLNRGGAPSPAENQLFWSLQMWGLVFVAAVAGVGYQPAIRIVLTDLELQLRVGRRAPETLALSHVRSAERIARETWQGHYRRFEATRSVVNRSYPHLALLNTDTGPLVLGIRPEELALFMEQLESALAARRLSQSTRVA